MLAKKLMRYPTLFAAALAVLFALSACVGPRSRDYGGSYGSGAQAVALTPAERRMRQESGLFSKSNVQGCMTGAVAGALLAALMTTRGRDHRGRNIAVGALAGCGLGVGVNSYVQSRRSHYYNHEARMRAMIADVRRDNANLARLISTSKEVMAEDRLRIVSIDNAYRAKTISTGEARAQMNRVRANRDHLRTTLSSLQRKERDWVQVSRLERQVGANTSGLDAEIGRLQRQVSSLEDEIELIDQQIAVSPVAA